MDTVKSFPGVSTIEISDSIAVVEFLISADRIIAGAAGENPCRIRHAAKNKPRNHVRSGAAELVIF